ncbi:MAG TPA: hypothetical protein VF972_07935 [Actinomycetota bacterium]
MDTLTKHYSDPPDTACTLETLEARRNALENQMFEVAGGLASRLHEVEEHITALQPKVHEIVCQSGRVPVDEKTNLVATLIQETARQIDLTAAVAQAERVTALKRRIADLEDQIFQGIIAVDRADSHAA